MPVLLICREDSGRGQGTFTFGAQHSSDQPGAQRRGSSAHTYPSPECMLLFMLLYCFFIHALIFAIKKNVCLKKAFVRQEPGLSTPGFNVNDNFTIVIILLLSLAEFHIALHTIMYTSHWT